MRSTIQTGLRLEAGRALANDSESIVGVLRRVAVILGTDDVVDQTAPFLLCYRTRLEDI